MTLSYFSMLIQIVEMNKLLSLLNAAPDLIAVTGPFRMWDFSRLLRIWCRETIEAQVACY